MGEKRYYPKIRKWLESQGYYCGGNITVRDKPNYYQDIGPRHRRADVAGVKNLGSKYEDQIEIVAVEVRDTPTISDSDIRDTDNYHQYAHKCYLATTAPIEPEHMEIAERRNIGLLSLKKGRKKPKLIHAPNPQKPANNAEMMDFLNSFEIVRCSICGCFFERYVKTKENYQSYIELVRARYFKTMSETQNNPLVLGEVKQLQPDYKLRLYICRVCLEELFMHPERIKKMKVHGRWIGDKKGFECLIRTKAVCSKYWFNTIEIVEHLRDKHDVNPDDQVIEGWTDRHTREWEKHASKKR